MSFPEKIKEEMKNCVGNRYFTSNSLGDITEIEIISKHPYPRATSNLIICNMETQTVSEASWKRIAFRDEPHSFYKTREDVLRAVILYHEKRVRKYTEDLTEMRKDNE